MATARGNKGLDNHETVEVCHAKSWVNVHSVIVLAKSY